MTKYFVSVRDELGGDGKWKHPPTFEAESLKAAYQIMKQEIRLSSMEKPKFKIAHRSDDALSFNAKGTRGGVPARDYYILSEESALRAIRVAQGLG